MALDIWFIAAVVIATGIVPCIHCEVSKISHCFVDRSADSRTELVLSCRYGFSVRVLEVLGAWNKWNTCLYGACEERINTDKAVKACCGKQTCKFSVRERWYLTTCGDLASFVKISYECMPRGTDYGCEHSTSSTGLVDSEQPWLQPSRPSPNNPQNPDYPAIPQSDWPLPSPRLATPKATLHPPRYPNAVGLANSNRTSKQEKNVSDNEPLDVGLIAGVIVGTLVISALCIGIAVWCRIRASRREQQALKESDKKSQKTPSEYMETTNSQIITPDLVQLSAKSHQSTKPLRIDPDGSEHASMGMNIEDGGSQGRGYRQSWQSSGLAYFQSSQESMGSIDNRSSTDTGRPYIISLSQRLEEFMIEPPDLSSTPRSHKTLDRNISEC